MEYPNRMRFAKCRSGVLVFILLIGIPSLIEAQSRKLEGMWSDTLDTAVGLFCFGFCTDAGIDRLNKLLDDPANDARAFDDISAEASNYQRETYIKPKLINDAAKRFPLNPMEDPSYVRCEPWGFARQIFAPHQLEIRQRDNSRIEMRYGEWDARRTVYLDGRKRPPNQAPAAFGHSVGHWEGDSLIIETSGISANIAFGAPHTDQLRVVERYTRSEDGKTLLLASTLEDPLSCSEPLVLKKIWNWSPQSRIAPYKSCERPTEITKGAKRP